MAEDKEKNKGAAGAGGGLPKGGGAGVGGNQEKSGAAGADTGGLNQMGAGGGGANDRRMAQNLEAARGGLQQAVEQTSPSFQAASAIGSAIGVGGSAKSDEEYNLVDAIWDALVVSILIWWGEGLVPLSSWMMDGLCKKNILRVTVLVLLIAAILLGILWLLVTAVDAVQNLFTKYVPFSESVFEGLIDWFL